jgi:hypothetical protein
MQSVNSEDGLIAVTRRIITLRITNPVSVPVSEIKTETNSEVGNLIQEEWKELGSEYPGYHVSSFGRVRGLKGKIFNGKPNRQGYVTASIISGNGQKVTYRVHILVATVFIPNPQNKPIVNHINGKTNDNRVPNLEWATYFENAGPMKLSQVRPDNRRRVIQYSVEGNPIRVWDSLTDAAYAVHGHTSGISLGCIEGSIRYGYCWRHYDDMIKPENEEWRSMVYNGTAIHVSNLGRVKNIQGRIVGADTRDGYIDIKICGSKVFVHRLVCSAWKPIDNPEMFMVNHIDNNGKNNRIDNLEWVTRADNGRHYRKNFHVLDSYNHGRSIKQLSKDGKTVIAIFASGKDAFERTGIDASNIAKVCQNKLKSAGEFVWQYCDT